MQTNNFGNNKHVSFGWYYPMHADIVNTAIRNPVLNKNILTKAVQKPDLDEFFLYGQKHFYYPKDMVKSYLDYAGTHNARYMFKIHMINALKAFRIGQVNEGSELAGRALHYLQDMTQPNHIDSGSIITKAKEAIIPHHKFEMDSYAKQNMFYENYTPVTIKANSFMGLFDETVKLSQKNLIPQRNNIQNWNNISQNAINLAISTTEKFLEMLEKYY